LADRDYPRPQGNYYENRHDFLTQGDIIGDVPWSQLGPSIIAVDPPPEGLPVPEGQIPALVYVSISRFAMVLSDTCDFRHPAASDIRRRPMDFPPGTVYHSGFVRVAPVLPLDEFAYVPKDEHGRRDLREWDHIRKIMYLPPLLDTEMADVAVALHMGDSLHIDLLLGLPRISQLTYVARQQLNHKLVRFDTGFRVPYDQFEPDLE
jgi:hypothetical protein